MPQIQSGDSLPNETNYAALERGDILYFPRGPELISGIDAEFLRQTALSTGSHHKNIAYKPEKDRVSGFDTSADVKRLHTVMRGYSQRALGFLRTTLPRYAADWQVDYASFRPQEEEGRDLAQKKRNDLLHVDAFPTRPTHGNLILRFFTNIHLDKARIWEVADPMADLAPRYADEAGLGRIAKRGRSAAGKIRRAATGLLHDAGLPVVDRAPYDQFMLGFHDYLKANADYQRSTKRYRFEFAPGSAWMVFTDIVPHSVLSGRYALEQTVIVNRRALSDPARAPITILESLCGTTLWRTRPPRLIRPCERFSSGSI